MVSGKDLAPDLAIANEAILLSQNTNDSGDIIEGITAGLVTVNNASQNPGRYAWVITDEGIKARIDISDKSENPTPHQKSILVRTPLESNPSLLGDDLAPLVTNTSDLRDSLISMKTLDLATKVNAPVNTASIYRHDITVGGYGLPTSVTKGGMKVDLSSVFDTTSWSTNYQLEVMGDTPIAETIGDATVYDFSINNSLRTSSGNFTPNDNSNKFYLDPVYSQRRTGPNWGNLYNYAQQWKQSLSGETKVTRLFPKVSGDIRTRDWAPYTSEFRAKWENDVQHTNSSIAPVLSMFQFSTRVIARETGVNTEKYQLDLQIKPVIGLWNPYNTKISSSKYDVAFGIYPYIQLGYDKAGTKGVKKVWLENKWQIGLGRFDLTIPEVDLEPGEIRLFTVIEDIDSGFGSDENTNLLTNDWSEKGGFIIPVDNSFTLSKDDTIWVEAMYLDALQHTELNPTPVFNFLDETAASWIALRIPDADKGHNILRIADLWQTPTVAQRNNNEEPYSIPQRVEMKELEEDYNKELIQSLDTKDTGSPLHMGTWRMSIRSSSQAAEFGDDQNTRTWLDSDPRAAMGNPAWDGSGLNGENYDGWNFLSSYTGSSHKTDEDQGVGGRGLIAERSNEGPSFPESVANTAAYRGFGGYSNDSSGQKNVILYDVPRSPLVSLGQFQHAQLSRYSFESAFPFGNSYASLRIPLDNFKSVNNFNDITNLTISDTSLHLNEALWDDFFFSTLAKGYSTGSLTGDLDSQFSIADLSSGDLRLPNPRYRYMPDSKDSPATTLASIHVDAGVQGMRAISSRIGVIGAFNVNSTSKTAWKAVLASMADFQLPIMSEDGTHQSWEDTEGIRFSKFGHHLNATGWDTDASTDELLFWTGYRKISADELDELAEAIVDEVKLRGPFRSFADFVNRDYTAEDAELQKKGALQAAIDDTINKTSLSAVGEPAEQPRGGHFSDALDDENSSAGYAGYLTQADILQSLAPVLTARSDYFCIRTKGESLDNAGNVMASAYCEAYVQRTASYVDSADEAHVPFDDLVNVNNTNLGRKFEIVSFRWLNSNEL